MGHVAGDERIAAGRTDIIHAPGQRINFPVIFHRIAGGHQRAAPGLRFHNQNGRTEPRDDPVPSQEVGGCRGGLHRVVGDEAAAGPGDHLGGQLLVLPGIDAFDARRHDAHRAETLVQGALVRDAIGPVRKAAHDAGRRGCRRKGFHQLPAPFPPVGAQVPRADNADHRPQSQDFRRRRRPGEI